MRRHRKADPFGGSLVTRDDELGQTYDMLRRAQQDRDAARAERDALRAELDRKRPATDAVVLYLLRTERQRDAERAEVARLRDLLDGILDVQAARRA